MHERINRNIKANQITFTDTHCIHLENEKTSLLGRNAHQTKSN